MLSHLPKARHPTETKTNQPSPKTPDIYMTVPHCIVPTVLQPDERVHRAREALNTTPPTLRIHIARRARAQQKSARRNLKAIGGPDDSR